LTVLTNSAYALDSTIIDLSLLHDANILDQLVPEAGAFCVMDRGHIDFLRLHRLHQAGSFFVTRIGRNMAAQPERVNNSL
jgi:hypothetical protein